MFKNKFSHLSSKILQESTLLNYKNSNTGSSSRVKPLANTKLLANRTILKSLMRRASNGMSFHPEMDPCSFTGLKEQEHMFLFIYYSGYCVCLSYGLKKFTLGPSSRSWVSAGCFSQELYNFLRFKFLTPSFVRFQVVEAIFGLRV